MSPNPTAEAAGSVIHQAVVTTANSSMTTITATFKNGLISTLNNQVFVGSLTSSVLWISKVNSYTDYSASTPRQSGEGASLILDDNLVALVPQESYMYVSAGRDLWYNVNLYDEQLFTIDSGNKLDKSKMATNNPTVNFVGRANQNNGITAVVNEIIGLEPYKKGYLTLALGGEYLGSCFIQPKDFYTSQNVNVLIPNNEISYNAKLFISIMIFKESRTYYKAFIDIQIEGYIRDLSFVAYDLKNAPSHLDLTMCFVISKINT